MKKILPTLLMMVIIGYMLSSISCRERIASAPGPIPTATFTPVPTPFNMTYDFEGSLDGWSNGGDKAFTGLSDVPASSVPNSVGVVSGSYCMAIACDFLGNTTNLTNQGEVTVNPVPSDFTSATTITAHVFIPSDLPTSYSVQLFILDNGTASVTGYEFHPAQYPVSSLTPNAWNTLTLSLVGLSGSGKAGLSAVDTVAVQLQQPNGSPNWTGTIYLDDVTVR